MIDDVVAPTTGTYLVLVASFDSGVDGTGTYRLTMAHTPGPITVTVGDDGGPLTSGVTHTGEITRATSTCGHSPRMWVTLSRCTSSKRAKRTTTGLGCGFGVPPGRRLATRQV